MTNGGEALLSLPSAAEGNSVVPATGTDIGRSLRKKRAAQFTGFLGIARTVLSCEHNVECSRSAGNKINYSSGRDLSSWGPAGDCPPSRAFQHAPPQSDQPWSISSRQNLRLQPDLVPPAFCFETDSVTSSLKEDPSRLSFS